MSGSLPDNTKKSNQKKKTPVDYVTPYNHLPVPYAFYVALQDYSNKRTHSVIKVALKYGAKQVDIAKALNIASPVLSRLLKREKK